MQRLFLALDHVLTPLPAITLTSGRTMLICVPKPRLSQRLSSRHADGLERDTVRSCRQGSKMLLKNYYTLRNILFERFFFANFRTLYVLLPEVSSV